MRRAVSLNPSSTASYWLLGHVLSRQDRHDEALAAASRAPALDPLDALAHGMAAQIAYSAGRTDLAAEYARGALRVEPDFWVGHWQLAQAYEQMGRIEEASDLLGEAARLSNGSSRALSQWAYVLAKAGRADRTREIVTALESPARDVMTGGVILEWLLGYNFSVAV